MTATGGLAGAIVILYTVLKGIQWATAPRASYATQGSDLFDQARRGEPWLLLGAILLPTLLWTYGHWWQHRWASRGMIHATDCIGKFAALDRLPGIYAVFGRDRISDSALGYYALAQNQARRLGIGRDDLNTVIDRRRADYAIRYADLARANANPQIDAQIESIRRCLNDDWPHDGIFNP